jgi:hypothetical protein
MQAAIVQWLDPVTEHMLASTSVQNQVAWRSIPWHQKDGRLDVGKDVLVALARGPDRIREWWERAVQRDYPSQLDYSIIVGDDMTRALAQVGRMPLANLLGRYANLEDGGASLRIVPILLDGYLAGGHWECATAVMCNCTVTPPLTYSEFVKLFLNAVAADMVAPIGDRLMPLLEHWWVPDKAAVSAMVVIWCMRHTPTPGVVWRPLLAAYPTTWGAWWHDAQVVLGHVGPVRYASLCNFTPGTPWFQWGWELLDAHQHVRVMNSLLTKWLSMTIDSAVGTQWLLDQGAFPPVEHWHIWRHVHSSNLVGTWFTSPQAQTLWAAGMLDLSANMRLPDHVRADLRNDLLAIVDQDQVAATLEALTARPFPGSAALVALLAGNQQFLAGTGNYFDAT